MPSDDYTSNVRGSLKLKGSAPAGVKKKKKSKPKTDESSLQKALQDEDSSISTSTPTDVARQKDKQKGREDGGEDEERDGDDRELRELESRDVDGDGKTASERAYEEMRRKRLHEKLQKEGVKTHKQRVEELNKYLSGLSEHHDMPKIGPG